ncbi:MAG TPA: beta-1,3-glucanase family protein, partial [Bacteroidia bacterium]|nr:beta-1,3-glucanase family protein [Bacteroidia bacterium]
TAPTQTAPTLSAGKSTLTPGTKYYYIVTATNANGETYASLEFEATPTAENGCVNVNWQPMSAATTAINIYRGTESFGENVLVQQVANTGGVSSMIDSGQSQNAPQSPPMYFPSGVPSSAYDQFFHLTNISVNGAAYAGPYDDQGQQSSTISTGNPASATITLGWERPAR